MLHARDIEERPRVSSLVLWTRLSKIEFFYSVLFTSISEIKFHENPNMCMQGVRMGIRQSDLIACLHGRVDRGRSSNTQERLFLNFRFFSNCSDKQPSSRFCQWCSFCSRHLVSYGLKAYYEYEHSREIGISKTKILIVGLMGETILLKLLIFLPIVFNSGDCTLSVRSRHVCNDSLSMVDKLWN
jgi:hypothetical protein